MGEVMARPDDARGFLHKRILGAVGGLITSGSPLGALSGFARGGRTVSTARPRPQTGIPAPRPPARAVVPRTETARPSFISEAGKLLGRALKFGGEAPAPTRLALTIPGVPEIPGVGCILPFRLDPVTNTCKIFLGDRPGPNGDVAVGEAVMGRYGAGMTAGIRVIDRAVCLRGMQLGNDGVCYNKGAIKNSERMWPAGRKPLLTGGDMNAISIAARAGRKLDATTQRLQRLGLMNVRRTRKKPAAHRHARKATGVVSV